MEGIRHRGLPCLPCLPGLTYVVADFSHRITLADGDDKDEG